MLLVAAAVTTDLPTLSFVLYGIRQQTVDHCSL